MRILAISNFYPPHHVSGYALLCADVLEALRSRGHAVTVLTSDLGGSQEGEADVHRVLTLESPLDYYSLGDAVRYPAAARRNLAHLQDLVDRVRPDVVFVWGMWNLSKRVAEHAERLMGSRVVYYLANPWPIEANQHLAFWALPTRRPWLNWLKGVVRVGARMLLRDEWRAVGLRFEHAPCCSLALRRQLVDAGVPLKDAPIIYEGIDIEAYVDEATQRVDAGPDDILSVVYVGLLVEHKGVHTAIEALSRLRPEVLARVHLTILGSGHPEYERRLRELVGATGLDRSVVFASPIPRTALPRFLAGHHVLVMPSIWEEPLALIMQEALASGLVLVGSATGGTTEIVVDGENGLLFPPGDAGRLAEHIERLVHDPGLRRRLAEQGQRKACQTFTLERMADDLSSYLGKVTDA